MFEYNVQKLKILITIFLKMAVLFLTTHYLYIEQFHIKICNNGITKKTC